MADVITEVASTIYFPGDQTSIKVSVPVYKLTRNCWRKITVTAYLRLT